MSAPLPGRESERPARARGVDESPRGDEPIAVATRRGRSLFWTISGLFLLAIVIGSFVQVLIAVAVLRPLEEREQRTRAELAASGLAAEIAAAPAPGMPELQAMLQKHRAALGPGPGVIAYREGSTWRLTDPPDRGRFLDRILSGAVPGGPPPGERPPFSERPPGQERGPRPPGGGSAPRLPERHDITVTRPVIRGSQHLGEVAVVRPLWPRGGPALFFEPASALLFLPVTLIASALVAFVVVRMLVRRLRAMELLAARVAHGDLSVRIGDPRGDEIGRLAQRLDRMTERLAEARARVEATEHQRRQLFADITHELATPLTSIRGYAETLLDPGVPKSDEEQGRYVRGVLEESRRLDRLIRDLFDLARLEAGASPLEKVRLDWAALCRNTAERFQPRFAAAGLRLGWSESPAEAWIEADGHRLEQVLENLLVNALRYVPKGGSVELALDSVPAGYRLTVRDDGPGLPAEDLSHAFERFYRGAGARVDAPTGDASERGGVDRSGAATDRGGSGLGLAIVREIVERHGGTVSARAREPRGLEIAVELPGSSSG
ncbi:MAG TPA: HAMP domain-containing sensor histidine kinase [Terriglobales bacterium]|nr:HAMP domain-containing sensor histidine kinase [Terriglobales bacterium]